jgi:hypothetical protein
MGHDTQRRKQLGGLLVVIVAMTAIAACTPTDTGGSTGSTTTTTAPTGLAHCPTPAAGQVRVAVVVDATGLASSTPSVVCVDVASGSTGATALVARAIRLGTALPRYNSSGLLCAIDGVPAAPACGSPTGGSFAYWSYWLGGTAWSYANVGPAGHGVVDGSVEGWRWVPSGTAVAPQTSPSFATLTS